MFRNFWPGIMGGAGASFTIGFSAAAYNISDIGFFPGDARSIIELRANGDVFQSRLNGSNGVIGTWAQGVGFDANDYDFMWDPTGNSPNWGPGDLTGIYLNGGGTLAWGAEENSGTYTANGILRIRPAGGGAEIDTATNQLYAESLP